MKHGMPNILLPGSIVIINEFDKPCDDLLAVLVRIKPHYGEMFGEFYYVNLLSRSSIVLAPLKSATLIEEFGRKISSDILESGKVKTEKYKKCVAKYLNEKPRRWQGW